MYSLEALRRKISKEGLEVTVQYLLSENLPTYLQKALEKNGIFKDGHLNKELLIGLIA